MNPRRVQLSREVPTPSQEDYDRHLPAAIAEAVRWPGLVNKDGLLRDDPWVDRWIARKVQQLADRERRARGDKESADD